MVVIVHTMQPMPEDVEKFHQPMGARTDMESILVCMVSFERNPAAATDTLLPLYRLCLVSMGTARSPNDT